MAPIKSRTNIIALIYDFDGTLSPGNMQEYRFMEAIGVDDKDAFWQEVDQMRDMHNANQILCSMRMMIEKARAAHVPITRLSFQNHILVFVSDMVFETTLPVLQSSP